MRNRVPLLIIAGLFAFIVIPNTSFAQNTNGTIDAVGISKKYYNSIVKVLLYDSSYVKIDPDKAYLGRGSGFFVSEDGYIFTNRHVIALTYQGFIRYQTYNTDDKVYENHVDDYDPSFLKDPNIDRIQSVGRASIIVQVFTNVTGDSFKLYHAHIVALDTANFDGAIIKIDADMRGNPIPVTEKFHPLPLGNSDSVNQGQDLCLLGFPAQYNGNINDMEKDLSTLVFGKHSGYDYKYSPIFGLIKTDAAINSGNSGGPVFGPNGRVIGLATAAFEKTNVGLIGGIDAMFYVSALIPDLQKKVVAEGLSAPQRTPAYITAALYRPKPLPAQKKINRANQSPIKAGVVNNRILVDMMLTTGVANNGTYQLQPLQTNNGLSGNAGTFKLSYIQAGGIDIRIAKPYIVKQKNNLIGMFLNISPSLSVPNWTSMSNSLYAINTTVTPNRNEYSSLNTNPTIYGSLGLGLSYSYLFTYKTSVTVYYSYGFIIDLINHNKIGSLNDTVPQQGGGNGTQTGDVEIDYSLTSRFTTNQTAGLFFRFKHLVIGAEYRMSGPENLTFTGNSNNNGGSNINFGSDGPQATLVNRSSINLFVGVAIKPKRKQD